ncbi:MAG TPA: Hsp70 family protein [Oscillatoriaceae cyanobacterium M33_DOE_052]|uniref:Hsp70 family protein n=1 Tax=Planktothricoides sp. SpSt-374 TaxID=2282167 RepID=A0A7C3ZV60_9CYAN|nr:Hsp70 family protein [Oscillatoriaceae cyanobacterium M33_DOE_052]
MVANVPDRPLGTNRQDATQTSRFGATLAIDFGSSNTTIAILNPHTNLPETVSLGDISRRFKIAKLSGEIRDVPVVPSLVFVGVGGELLLGNQVRSAGSGLAQPQRLFTGFKRELAADFQPPPRQIDGANYTAASVSELFLKGIWERLRASGVDSSRLIFTVPVGAFERYLDWFREIGMNQFGASEVHCVDESTAAALGYAVQRVGSLVLVVDFGGGTLDLSLIRTSYRAEEIGHSNLKQVQAEVLAKSDAYVGGIDVDTWIVEDYLQQIGSSRGEVKEGVWHNLLAVGERLKMKLSRSHVAKESWGNDDNFPAGELQLTRARLEQILEERQLLQQVRQALDEVILIAANKGISKNQIEQVIMVGGSCLIPAVQQLVVSYFGRSRVKVDKVFEAASHGALALTQLQGLDDYLHHSYAIRLWEPQSKSYSYFTLFERGCKYPLDRPSPLTLQAAVDGQQEIRLDIGELAQLSEAEVTFDTAGRMTNSRLYARQEYRSLETHRQQVCVAYLEPPGQPGIDRVWVYFEVDDRRMLLVTVRDLLTGKVLLYKRAIASLT